MQVVGFSSEQYPTTLRDLASPPRQLFLIGDASLLQSRAVAIVGTRDASPYGLRMARLLAAAFSKAGVTVVSGLARGIDSAAHRATLETGGPTVAVLGTGVNVPYPVGNRELHRVIGERGLIVSEFGLDISAGPGAFPRRNRIIAALASVTVVVEAGHRSGALNTARHALDLGRVVAAVPGPVDSHQSAGSNQLLRDGGHVIASVHDALALAGVTAPGQASPPQLSASGSKIWRALDGGPLTPDALAVKCELSVRDCLTEVTTLEIQALVECLVTGEIRRR